MVTYVDQFWSKGKCVAIHHPDHPKITLGSNGKADRYGTP